MEALLKKGNEQTGKGFSSGASASHSRPGLDIIADDGDPRHHDTKRDAWQSNCGHPGKGRPWYLSERCEAGKGLKSIANVVYLTSIDAVHRMCTIPQRARN